MTRFSRPGSWAILDTSVYIDHWQQGRHRAALDRVATAFIVRQSAVVLSELRRGARTPAAQRRVEQLHARTPVVWEPTPDDWWEAGRLIRTVGDTHAWDPAKRRNFQNDALIALTARRHGALLVTTNREDFEILGRALRVSVLVLPDPTPV